MLPNPEDTYLVVLPVKIPHYFTFKIIMEKNKDSWRKKKKNASPRQALCLPSKPSLRLETRHFSPPAYLRKLHWQYGPSTPDPDCQDQALYKMHFSSLFPYKK